MFRTDVAHQIADAESFVEYACAAINVRMYSAGEETEVVLNTFQEAPIIGYRWVYKINAKHSIGQQRLVSTALEHPSPSWRGTAISASEKSTFGNESVSMGMPNIDDRDPDRRVDDGKRNTETEGGNEEDAQEGELGSGQRRDDVRRKFDSGHSLCFSLALSSSTCSMESTL